MITIAANELKTKGISLLSKSKEADKEAVITVRGKPEYVILDMERYNQFRDFELEVALRECKEDIKNGKTFVESVDDHIDRLKNAL